MGSTSAKTMSQMLPRLPLFEAISKHDPESTAVIHCLSNRTFRYGELLGDVARARDRLVEAAGRNPGDDLSGERLAFLVENGYDYVVTLLSIFAARAIAVPLSPAFPPAELQYILNQSGALLLCTSQKFMTKAQAVMKTELDSPPTLVVLEKHLGLSSSSSPEEVSLQGSPGPDSGMMLYTSGTTNRPKGVLLPTPVLEAQCASLMEAWKYTEKDHLLHVLPLHHIHGTINALLTPLMAGSAVEFLFPFNADRVWKRFAAPFLPPQDGPGPEIPKKAPITFFTVVPTVYTRLISTFPSLSPPALQTAAQTGISPQHLRVNISGSAALPTPIKQAWSALSGGNVLLERYGMTEVGMALSCGLDFADRVDASVGWPLPSVQVRLVDLDTGKVIKEGEEEVEGEDGKKRERQGEIQLRGPTVFKEYFRNPEATAKEFAAADEGDADQRRWFRTGDVAVRKHVASLTTTTAASSAISSNSTLSPHASSIATASSPTNGSSLTSTPSATSSATNLSSSTIPEPKLMVSAGSPGSWTSSPYIYFIHGRKSADIIKSGGEKVSALEVERELLSLPQVSEAAVVAVPSGKWGQKVGCVLVLDKDYFLQQEQQQQEKEKDEEEAGGGGGEEKRKRKKQWGPMDMRRALRDRLVNYKIPQVMKVVDEIKRNAMGKVNKKALVKEVFEDEFSGDEM